MSRKQGHRRPRKRRWKQGFSRPVSRQWFEMLGVRQDQKRDYFNLMARNVVASFAVTAGVFGLISSGWIAAGLLGGLATGFGVWFVVRDRMFR